MKFNVCNCAYCCLVREANERMTTALVDAVDREIMGEEDKNEIAKRKEDTCT